MTINLNDFIKVKLTDWGKEIYYHQYDEVNSFWQKEVIKPSFPKVDEDGYTSFQLWHFMNLYGNYIDMGLEDVIYQNEILLDDPRWIPVSERLPSVTPQESIFDKMRAEIIEKYWGCDICKWKTEYKPHYNIIGDIDEILQIIDKYTKGAEE